MGTPGDAAAPAPPGGVTATFRFDEAESAELIRIGGVVQGVGFRYSARQLALRHGLRGWVANVGRGVVIHACGPTERLEAFVHALQAEIGPPARVESLRREPAEPLPADAGFRIAPSE